MIGDIRNDSNWINTKKTAENVGITSIQSIRVIAKNTAEKTLDDAFVKRFFNYNLDEDDPTPFLNDYLTSTKNTAADARFNDNYDTGTSYTLRELLVLVWWLRPKKSREFNVKIPEYFVNIYSEDVHKITDKFINDEVLFINDDNLIKPTVVGIIIYEKFGERLWEIHSKSSAVIDEVFDNWNLNSYTIQLLKDSINFNKQYLKYYNDLLLWQKRHDDKTALTQLHIAYYVAEQKRIENEIKSLESQLNSH